MGNEFVTRNYLGETYYYNTRTNKWFDHSFCAAPIGVIYALGGNVIRHTIHKNHVSHRNHCYKYYYCSTDALDYKLPGCFGMGKNR